MSSIVLHERAPVITSTIDESLAKGAVFLGDARHESFLGVPILVGNTVIGVVDLESLNQHAYDEDDARLLATIATSMGVALENARLFDETKRLLGEADERAAELTVINEIGEALARQLEFDAIIQLVGERVRALFAVQSAFIALHDPVTNLITFPYDLDEGLPFDRGSMPLGPGLTSTVIVTGRSLRIGSEAEQEAAGALQAGGADTVSWLGAPITGANRVIGVLGLERLEEHAFTQADERVVSTLASSMGVALENARLFDETKRLLAEADERTGELR